MAFKFIPDPDFFKQIVAEGKVTEALDDVADKILATAKQLALSDGLTDYAALLTSTSGTRPKGRTYAEVTAYDTEAEEGSDQPGTSAAAYEWGTEQVRRRRILGTAAGTTIFPD